MALNRTTSTCHTATTLHGSRNKSNSLSLSLSPSGTHTHTHTHTQKSRTKMSAAIELTESPPVHTHINMRVLESYLIRSLSRQGCKASACGEFRDLPERVKDRDEMSKPSRQPATLFFKRRSEQSPVKRKRRSGASTSVGGMRRGREGKGGAGKGEKFVAFVLLR